MSTGNQSNPDSSPPEKSGSRTFWVAAGILGVIILLSVAGLAAYALLILPTQRGAQQQAATAPAIQNALIAHALTSIAGVFGLPTATITPPPAQARVTTTAGTPTAQTLSIQTVTITQPPTRTPVVAQAAATQNPTSSVAIQATASVSAALTQTAAPQLTPVASSTALPGTGIGDQYGPSGLVVAGIVLVGVIFLARWLRLGAAQA